MSARCSGFVYGELRTWPYPCGFPAKVEREGQHYCRVHDPVEIEKRKQARRARQGPTKFEREMAASDREKQLRVRTYTVLSDLLAAAKAGHLPSAAVIAQGDAVWEELRKRCAIAAGGQS